jgi:polyferredoxin
MDRFGYPHGLIRYSTQNAIERKYPESRILANVFRPRILLYGAVLLGIILVFFTALYLRSPLKVDVIRDRATLVREMEDGSIENVFRLQIMNTDERPHRYHIAVTGLAGLRIEVRQPVEVAGATTQAVAVAVRIDPAGIKPGSHAIVFHVTDSDEPSVKADEKSMFYVR